MSMAQMGMLTQEGTAVAISSSIGGALEGISSVCGCLGGVNFGLTSPSEDVSDLILWSNTTFLLLFESLVEDTP